MEAVINEKSPESLLRFGVKNKLPVILQSEAAECALICLNMIACFHGFETDPGSLRRRLSISSQGTSLKSLMDMAERLHFSSRALRLEIDQLGRLNSPCILHWDMNHFVVLKEVNRKHVVIHDPAVGERKLSLEEASLGFTGVALELIPTPEFQRGEEKLSLKLSHFWSRIIGLKRNLAQIILLSFLLQLFAIATPFYMQTVVDDVILRNDANLLLALALGFGLLLLIQTGTTALRELIVLQLTSRLNIQMAANLFRHLIRLPMDYFAKRHMGDVVSRFGSLEHIRQLITSGLVAALVDGVMAVITLTAMFFYDRRLTLIVLAVVVVYLLIRLALYRPLRLLSEEQIVAGARHDTHFMESVRAIQTIKLFQRENERQNEWQNRLADSLNKGIQISRWHIGYDAINGLLFGLENLIVIYFAATAVMGNVISLGMLYAFMSYKTRFVASVDTLIVQLIELKMLNLHLGRLADIVHTQPEVRNHSPVVHKEQEPISGAIEVRDLGFRYSDTQDHVFRNVSFTVAPEETVVIVGPSGCGKSTLLKCLMGLLQPQEGGIFIDGQPAGSHPYYRQSIAAVMQEEHLLGGSIADNIACFSPQVDLQKIRLCAQLACVGEEIENMPMQYNTLIGDLGSNLSGGQKQRIVLARAIYREPRILFLDEATSHLDVASEQRINQHTAMLNMTKIIVAHREETIRGADRRIDLAQPGES